MCKSFHLQKKVAEAVIEGDISFLLQHRKVSKKKQKQEKPLASTILWAGIMAFMHCFL